MGRPIMLAMATCNGLGAGNSETVSELSIGVPLIDSLEVFPAIDALKTDCWAAIASLIIDFRAASSMRNGEKL